MLLLLLLLLHSLFIATEDSYFVCDVSGECGSTIECECGSNCYVYCNGSGACDSGIVSAREIETFYLSVSNDNSFYGPDIINVSSLITNMAYSSISNPRVNIQVDAQFGLQSDTIVASNVDSFVLGAWGAKAIRYGTVELSNMCWVELGMSTDAFRCINVVFTFDSIEMINMDSQTWECICDYDFATTNNMLSVSLSNTVIAVDSVIKTSSDITNCDTYSDGIVTYTNYNPNGYTSNDVNITNIFEQCSLVSSFVYTVFATFCFV